MSICRCPPKVTDSGFWLLEFPHRLKTVVAGVHYAGAPREETWDTARCLSLGQSKKYLVSDMCRGPHAVLLLMPLSSPPDLTTGQSVELARS